MRCYSVLALTCIAVVTSEGSDRNRLLSLLDAHNPTEYLSSLLESKIMLSSGHRRRDPPPRRRHTPCECPDNLDAMANDCVNTRFNLLLNNYDGIMTMADSQTGETTASADISLRVAAQTLNETFLATDARVAAVSEYMTDPSNGTIEITSQTLKKLLNEESLMALSVNNAWMNLINATSQAGVDGNTLLSSIVNATDFMSQWFNGLQNSEENVTDYNFRMVEAYVNYGFGQVLTKINAAQNTVWSVLTALDANMGGSETSTSDLSDALQDASDNLTGELSDFSASFPDLGGDAADILGQSLNQMVNDFESQVQTSVGSVQSTATNKQQVASTAAQQSVDDQDANAYQPMLVQFQNDTAKLIASTSAGQDAFTNTTNTEFDAVSGLLAALAANTTQSITAQETPRKANLTLASQQSTSVVSATQTLSTNEARAAAAAVASELNYKTSAANTIQTSTASYDSRHGSIVAAAGTISDGSVDAVGTSTRSSLDNMGSQYNSLQNSLASQAQTAAVASVQTTGSLGQTTQASSAAMGQAGNVVTGQMSATFGANLNQLGALNTGIAGDPGPVIASGQAYMAQTAAAGDAAAAGAADAPSLSAAAATGGSLNDMLTAMMNSGMSFDQAIAQVSQQIQLNAAAPTPTADQSGALANAGANIANAGDSFAAMLANYMQSGALTGDGAAVPVDLGVNTDISTDAVDQSTAGLTTAGQGATDAIANMQATLGNTWSSVSNSAGGSSAALDSNIQSSSAEIDQTLSAGMSSASQAVSSQMQQISALQGGSAVQLGQISTAQLSQVRAAAAAIETLMKQMNAFLASQNGPLYTQVSQLPVDAQTLQMRFNVLANETDSIANNTLNSIQVQNPHVLVKQLFDQLRQAKSNALSLVDGIGSSFNTSASSYAASFVGEVKDISTEFVTAAANLQTELGSLSSTAGNVTQTLSPDGGSVINNLLAIHDQLAQIYGNNSGALGNFTGVGGPPASLPDLLASISSINAQAAADAANVSAQLDNLTSQAQIQVAAAQEFQSSDGAPPSDEIDKDAAMARMNEGIATSKLAAQQTAMTQLQTDSSSVVTDLAASADLDAQAKANQADSVYDSVLQAKADVSTEMGNILNSVASGQTGQGATLATNDATNAINLQTMRNALNGLMNIFTTYMQTEKVQFASSDDDRSNFTTALAMEVVGNLTSVERTILADNSEMTDNTNTISEEETSFDNADVDSALVRVNGELDDWSSAETAQVADVQTDVNNLPQTNAFNYTKVSSKLTATEQMMAQSAITLITQFGNPVPAELTALAAR